jgi:NAD(P)H-flavin reductase
MSVAEDDTVRDYVATEVRAQLARKRLSVREAARRLGWGQTVLYHRVVGNIGFDVSELAAVARLLDLPIGSFFPPEIAGAENVVQIGTGSGNLRSLTPGRAA